MPRTLAENAQYINETIKPAIKSAIEAQGVTVPSTDSFLDYADRIGEIEGGGSGYQLKDLPTGSISTVNDAAELPLNALKVSVEAWQEGTGDPSPSNIRPIHGWDSGTITDISNYYVGSPSFDGYSNLSLWTKLDETYRGHEVYKRTSAWNGIYKAITLPVGVYTFSASAKTSDEANVNVYFVRNDSTATTNIDEAEVTTTTNWARISATFEVLQEGTVAVRIERATVGDIYISEYQIERGNTAHDYCSYQLNTVTQQFPTTIYGAEWDVVGGVLDLTHYLLDNANDGQLTKNIETADSVSFRIQLPFNDPIERLQDDYILCNKLRKESLTASNTYCVQVVSNVSALANNSIWFNLPPSVATTANEARQWLIDEGVQFVYHLANPPKINQQPLTPRMLQGTNNLYADCGDVIEGEYFVDEGAHKYQLYDYIESDGTQVIDLGFAPENGATVTTSFVLLSTQTSEAFVYGATDSSAWLGFAQNPASRNTIYENNTTGRSEAYIQNQQYLLTLMASRDYTNHLCMFGFYLSGYAPGIKTRLCYCKYNDNFYLPAKRKSDGVFGLWDVANQTFLTDSAGGNAFVGGNPTGVEV